MLKNKLFQNEMSRRRFWFWVLALIALRLALCSQQRVYTWIDGAPLDDELMFQWAQSISAGQWLGPYDFLTLSKRPFFAVWLALLNRLGIPYLLGGQALWCAAALAGALAFAPLIKKYRARLILFGFLCWNPAACASFTWRVYRDNIYPALCLLFFAGLIGWLLRCPGPLKKSLGWLILAGVGLGCGWLCREDGVWVLPFGLAALAAGLVVLWRRRETRHKALKSLAALLPFGMLAASIGAVCALNQSWYGVAVLSDFSEGSFADAIGAMTRVKEEDWQPLVSVPASVRRQLYQAVPQLQPLEYWLEEDEDLQNSYRNPALDDYQSGSFYWALRQAAQNEGVYETPQKAEEYWAGVAQAINTLCEEGALPSEGGRRSSTTPPIRAEYVPGVLAESLRSLGYVLTCGGCQPYEADRTIGTTEDLAVWEEYLHTPTNVAAVAGTDDPYYNPLQKGAFALLSGVRWLYALALPLSFAAGTLLWLRAGWLLWKKRRQTGGESLLVWFILLAVLAMAALRIGMIAFVEVASFNIGTYVMYLATVHPLLILFSGVACLHWGPGALRRKDSARPQQPESV